MKKKRKRSRWFLHRKMTLKVLLDSAALRQLQNITYFLKPIHFFDKIKLILDPPGLSKKKQLILLFLYTVSFWLAFWPIINILKGYTVQSRFRDIKFSDNL
jgi:hypothetical protein